MFIMDAPYVPAQETPIVFAQANAPAASTPRPDYILRTCGETESTGDPRSAMRAVDPAYMLKNYLQARDNYIIGLSAIKNVTLLEGTKHGELLQGRSSNTGRTTFHYNPIPNYIGKDQAIFLAEFEGKRYKIVLELHVFIGVDENNPTCPAPQLIEVTKPSSGANGFDLNSINVSTFDLAGLSSRSSG